MRPIIEFITRMLPYMLIALPVLLFARIIIYIVGKKKQLEFSLLHEIGVIFFALYLVGLASQAVIPELEFGSDGIIFLTDFGINFESINLIPFNKISETWQIAFVNGNINYLYIEVFGNIGLFIIIGFMLPLLWTKFKSIKNTISACFIFSLFFELAQLFLPRVTDVDDLIMNTFGGIVGYYLYLYLFKAIKKATYKFNH